MVGFATRAVHRAGGVTLLSHSGSALCSMVDAEARLDYNYVVSPGQELVCTLADYMDFAIIGDAEGTLEDGILTLRVDLRPPAERG